MKLFSFFGLLIVLSSFTNPFAFGDPYKGCCGAEPVEIKVGDANVFIPNVFTPNGDGINDVFKPFYDAQKIQISQVVISNADGKIVWKTDKFSPEQPTTAWSGRVGKDSTYTGRFTYTMVFSDKAGTTKVVGGSACSAICNPNVPISIADKSKCFFPMQYQKDSVNHQSPLFLEIECLKQ
jgi:gliding motility-associated-like protein